MSFRYVNAAPWTADPAGHCRSRTHLLRQFITARYPDADNLGCYGNRAATGSTVPSVHRDGRAADSGFLRDEPGRQDCYLWLVDNADVLGLQMVLNYKRRDSPASGVLWRLPRYWDETNSHTGLFNKIGHWLHWELHPTVADDKTPIAQLVGVADPGPSISNAPGIKEITVQAVMQQVRRGDGVNEAPNGFVRKLQVLLQTFNQDVGAADGRFGPRTDTAIRNVQGIPWAGLTVDGICGEKTWEFLLQVAPV